MSESREIVYLTVREYAETRKISETTVRRMIAIGMLPVERVSPRRLRIRMRRVLNSSHQSPHAPTS